MIKWIESDYDWNSEDGRFEIYYPKAEKYPTLLDKQKWQSFPCDCVGDAMEIAEQIIKNETDTK